MRTHVRLPPQPPRRPRSPRRGDVQGVRVARGRSEADRPAVPPAGRCEQPPGPVRCAGRVHVRRCSPAPARDRPIRAGPSARRTAGTSRGLPDPGPVARTGNRWPRAQHRALPRALPLDPTGVAVRVAAQERTTRCASRRRSGRPAARRGAGADDPLRVAAQERARSRASSGEGGATHQRCTGARRGEYGRRPSRPGTSWPTEAPCSRRDCRQRCAQRTFADARGIGVPCPGRAVRLANPASRSGRSRDAIPPDGARDRSWVHRGTTEERQRAARWAAL
jgi:hypothetical protein